MTWLGDGAHVTLGDVSGVIRVVGDASTTDVRREAYPVEIDDAGRERFRREDVIAVTRTIALRRAELFRRLAE